MTSPQLNDIYDSLSCDPFGISPSYPFRDTFGCLHHLPTSRRFSNFATKPNSPSEVDPSKFQLLVNVKHFKAEEVFVMVVKEFIVVTAKHVEQPDEHGLVSRSFTRRYKVPDDVESDKIKSSFSRDGILTIKAPRKIPPALDGGRIVEIELQQPQMMEEGIRRSLLDGIPGPKGDSKYFVVRLFLFSTNLIMGIRKKRKQPPKRSTTSVLPNADAPPKRRGRPPKKAKKTKVEEKEEECIALDTVQSSPEERLKCSICLDTSRCKKMKVLPCCHDFHEKCINRWFEVDIKCPLCRTWYLDNVDGLVS